VGLRIVLRPLGAHVAAPPLPQLKRAVRASADAWAVVLPLPATTAAPLPAPSLSAFSPAPAPAAAAAVVTATATAGADGASLEQLREENARLRALNEEMYHAMTAGAPTVQ
jgi:hypothetical protein